MVQIIHRPASALKELLENSPDTGSTLIQVTITVQDGSMKLLWIQKNSCGICKEDLSLLAKCFTTSKLTTFSDLSKLTTYGFRAHLMVIINTNSSSCTWKAAYVDGGLALSKAGYMPDLKAWAGNNGTITMRLVKTLPHLLHEYIPILNKLPIFLMCLGPQVLWKSKQTPLSVIPVAASDEDEQDKQKYEAWHIQNILFHVMHKFLAAPKDNGIMQVASLLDLYQVFKLSSNTVRLYIILQFLFANTGA
ncbi:hypothetical protein BDR06DRAFT_971684 [Suillus hirtellus]|nr:hypothetical protein BDR06DRAFT_971684 [Suillus hirtellus]